MRLDYCQQLDLRELHDQARRADSERQQRKVIAYFIRERFDLSTRDVQVTEEERSRFFQMIRDGRIGEGDYRKFLSSISPPKRDPQHIFQKVNLDRQKKGIIAGILDDFNKRDSLVVDDISSFITLNPHPMDYELAVKRLLDIVESNNVRKKRQEYEEKADEVGLLLYGKQWEYLRAIRSLQKQDRLRVESERRADNKDKGIEQSREYLRNHRIEGYIHDGFKDGGRTSTIDSDGKVVSPGEIIVVDRERDKELNTLIEKAQQIAQEIRGRKGSEEEVVFSIAQLVYKTMHASDAQIKVQNLPVNKEVLLGNIQSGVCRHRSLLFQVLASEVGIQTAMRRGFCDDGYKRGHHAWNEVKIGGLLFLVDISLTDFRKFRTFQDFKNLGGFRKIKNREIKKWWEKLLDRIGNKTPPNYFDINTKPLY